MLVGHALVSRVGFTPYVIGVIIDTCPGPYCVRGSLYLFFKSGMISSVLSPLRTGRRGRLACTLHVLADCTLPGPLIILSFCLLSAQEGRLASKLHVLAYYAIPWPGPSRAQRLVAADASLELSPCHERKRGDGACLNWGVGR